MARKFFDFARRFFFFCVLSLAALGVEYDGKDGRFVCERKTEQTKSIKGV
jgi:hypothetical protein